MDEPPALPEPSSPEPSRMEAALREILAQARAAQSALCENELLVRLENIAREAESALADRP